MKEFFKRYIWLWEMIGAAILFAIAFIVGFVESVLLILVGLIMIFLGVLRIIPLIKTTEDKLMKWLFAIEIIVDVAAGGVLFYLGMSNKNPDAVGKAFGYIVGGVAYLKALVYLFATTLRKEATNLPTFLVHIGLITIGSIIIGAGGFERKTLAYVIMGLSILASLFIAANGYKGYKNYRNEELAKHKTKNIKVQKEKGIDAPSADEIIERQNPDIDENPRDRDQLNA